MPFYLDGRKVTMKISLEGLKKAQNYLKGSKFGFCAINAVKVK
jgi:hypothetical protein